MHEQLDTISKKYLQVISDKNSFFKLFNSNVEIYASLKQFKNHKIENFFTERSALINIQFWYYNVKTKKWDSYTESKLKVNENSVLHFENNKIFVTKYPL